MQKEVLFFDLRKDKEIRFKAFGVNVCIKSLDNRLLTGVLESLPILLPNNVEYVEANEVDFHFYLTKLSENLFEFYKNNELMASCELTELGFLNYFLSYLRLTIAEHAVSKVFLHAGVVSWKGKAIILPADSYGGKTTIVSELSKIGAKYYSDEYAVLNENGFVEPFPKMLSVRGIIDANHQKDISVESIGGVTGTEPIPVGLVFFTEYKEGAKWKPEVLTPGQGILKIISHTIPIRSNPDFTLKVLNKILKRAIIAKSQRGEAAVFAKHILNFVGK